MNKEYVESYIKATREKISRFLEFKGQLSKSAGNLYSFLEERFAFEEDMKYLEEISSKEKDFEISETLINLNKTFLDTIEPLNEEAFNIPKEILEKFIEEEQNLNKYKDFLFD